MKVWFAVLLALVAGLVLTVLALVRFIDIKNQPKIDLIPIQGYVDYASVEIERSHLSGSGGYEANLYVTYKYEYSGYIYKKTFLVEHSKFIYKHSARAEIPRLESIVRYQEGFPRKLYINPDTQQCYLTEPPIIMEVLKYFEAMKYTASFAFFCFFLSFFIWRDFIHRRNMKKKVGKAAEHTIEELQFIYGRSQEGLSDRDIVERPAFVDIAYRHSSSLKRRHREYEAAKKVLEELLKKNVDPVLARHRIRHWNDLANTAGTIRSNIKKVRRASAELIGNILSGSISNPIIFGFGHKESLDRADSLFAGCLLSHLREEFSEFRGLSSWDSLRKGDIDNLITEKMLRTLDKLSHDKVFSGTCIICRSWE